MSQIVQTSTERPALMFVRIDDERIAGAAYRIGSPDCPCTWSPSRTMTGAAACLHDLATWPGAKRDVTALREGRRLTRRRQQIRATLARVVQQIGECSPELGLVLRRFATETDGDRVLAYLPAMSVQLIT